MTTHHVSIVDIHDQQILPDATTHKHLDHSYIRRGLAHDAKLRQEKLEPPSFEIINMIAGPEALTRSQAA